MSEAIVAQCLAPASEPANNAFFRLRAIGRMDRSTVLPELAEPILNGAVLQASAAALHYGQVSHGNVGPGRPRLQADRF